MNAIVLQDEFMAACKTYDDAHGNRLKAATLNKRPSAKLQQ